MKRTLSYDCIRIVACIMVVLMHSESAGIGAPGIILSGIGYVTSPCIGLFFMLSGALVLGRATKTQDFSMGNYLRKRMPRLIVPLLFWLSFGMILKYLGFHNNESSVLWFMWPLIGIYLLVPVLRRWLQDASRHEVEFYLLLWACSLLYPWLRLFMQIRIVHSSWLFYYSGYAGYFLLGYYLTSYKLLTKQLNCLIFAAFAFCFVAPPVVLLSGIEFKFDDLFWYLSPSSALQCIFWFLLICKLENWLQKIGDSFKRGLAWVSKQTFGIYLMHMILLSFYWDFAAVFGSIGFIRIIGCAFLTFVSSLVLVAIVNRIPGLRLIVGG